MPTILLLAFLSLAIFAGPVDQNGNPVPPTLVSIHRFKGHVEVCWDYPLNGDPDAFQLMRRSGETFTTTVIGLHRLMKSTTTVSSNTVHYCYADKSKIDRQTTYIYTLIVFTPDGTSLASQPLVSTP